VLDGKTISAVEIGRVSRDGFWLWHLARDITGSSVEIIVTGRRDPATSLALRWRSSSLGVEINGISVLIVGSPVEIIGTAR
jgi:hypothetical protein